MIAALALPGPVAWADQSDISPARFRVEAQLRPAEARYTVTAELRATAPAKPGPNRFTLKQLQAPEADCAALGDAIFADQFE